MSASDAVTGPLRGQNARFGVADEHMTLDGRMDEPAWLKAPAVSTFFEIYPKDVGSTQVRTEVRFLFDSRNIYIAIRAYDSKPNDIRTSFVRRDQVGSNQDYVELLLDPINSRRSAFLFRVNANGVVTDALFSEETQIVDYSVDLDFDAKTSVDDVGWVAEFRIPLSTLRFQPGVNRSWAFVVRRHWPRDQQFQFSSAPIPRAANCVLCFAGELTGVSITPTSAPLTVTPYVTYLHQDVTVGSGRSLTDVGRVGADIKWQPRTDTSVDVTLRPDFSQVEADDLQLSANTRFALALPEKRAFFLESTDLLYTPISAVYTRAFAAPDGGARITRRGEEHEYTALLLRDSSRGSILEPGPVTSTLAPQPSESTSVVVRNDFRGQGLAAGSLVTSRLNDDGSANTVLGADLVWSPTSSDRITAQVLWSRPKNPERPDLIPLWLGQRFDGQAGDFIWNHTTDAWSINISYQRISDGFRAWNGFVPQVGASTLAVDAGVNFYTNRLWLTRVSPTIYVNNVERANGASLGHYVSPGLLIEGGHNTTLSIAWYPHRQDMTLVGLRPYSDISASLITTPAPWLPGVSLSVLLGDGLNTATGEVGLGTTVQATVPLQLWDRFELSSSVGYQSLELPRRPGTSQDSFTEVNTQISGRWHFSSRLYVEALYQKSQFSTVLQSELPDAEVLFRHTFLSLLLSYQSDWQTRLYVGLNQGGDRAEGIPSDAFDQAEAFVKLTYAFR